MSTAETAPPEAAPPEAAAPPPTLAGSRLLHRWFVEYNPLYLVSAMLVLVGLTLLSRAAADEGTMHQELGYVPIIAEAYALSLIAGAALLMRIGYRRPAVMLGLLTVLYQGDLTLLAERQVHLGWIGLIAAACWLALFVAKLHALGWALKVRLSHGFVAVAGAGAAGLMLLPHYLSRGHASGKEAVVAGWIFALSAAVLWGRQAVVSKVPLDAWQRTVLSRSLRATWVIWGMAVLLHVAFWSSEYRIGLHVLAPGALLLATRWMQNERSVWATVAATLGVVAHVAPASFSGVALLAAAVLALRALVAETTTTRVAGAARRGDGYRWPGGDGSPPAEVEIETLADPAAQVRLYGGAMFGVWLAGWTHGWTGGALPAHVLSLDLALTFAALIFAWKARARAILAPLSLSYLHFAVQARLIAAPASAGQWGATAIVVGFALLIGSLVFGWRMRHHAEDPDPS